jgi:hypothetical protein
VVPFVNNLLSLRRNPGVQRDKRWHVLTIAGDNSPAAQQPVRGLKGFINSYLSPKTFQALSAGNSSY